MTGDRLHLHLDPMGGIAGDMMLAALLDAFPDLEQPVTDLAATIGPGISLKLTEAREKGLRGRRIAFDLPTTERGPRHLPDYRTLLQATAPDPGVAGRALDILERLAHAEATVHGVPLDKVHFHEISDWDSIADILLTSFVLERIGIVSASTSPIPLGSGQIETEHGTMPVPAPATLELLRGRDAIDDGRPGERVTPTGAAILAHLEPASRRPLGQMRLQKAGYGLGNRSLDGMANCLRLSFFQLDALQPERDRVAILTFHIDDQIPEDLAVALDRLRGRPDVLDVLQFTVQGKKGRTAFRLEVICREEAADAVAHACFGETTTIGMRLHREDRLLLPRREVTVERNGMRIRTKLSVRPDGTTIVKPENDDVAQAGENDDRSRIRLDVANALSGRGIGEA
ncbi:LarC family nickel insertion protein [Tropicimonas aquimaris]|uniref:LarC family nickel insertion protein n=1 Tax=Tropicimonas aquimaris TaxID=914152 RepID=A0ABW3IX51_9RHOB